MGCTRTHKELLETDCRNILLLLTTYVAWPTCRSTDQSELQYTRCAVFVHFPDFSSGRHRRPCFIKFTLLVLALSKMLTNFNDIYYANRLPVFIISFHLLATLLQFLGYVLAHHFLAQLHEQKKFESFVNFALNKYQSPL